MLSVVVKYSCNHMPVMCKPLQANNTSHAAQTAPSDVSPTETSLPGNMIAATTLAREALQRQHT